MNYSHYLTRTKPNVLLAVSSSLANLFFLSKIVGSISTGCNRLKNESSFFIDSHHPTKKAIKRPEFLSFGNVTNEISDMPF